MGRPRQTKIDAIRFVAHRDNETKQFESRREATLFASTARRSSRVEPIYYKARFWTLKIERFPLQGEERCNESDYSGLRLTEEHNTIKGADPEALRARAGGLRRASFQKEWPVLRLEKNLRQLSPESRLLALECSEAFFDQVDDHQELKEAERKRNQAKVAKQAALDAIPTIAEVFKIEVERKLAAGAIQRNTADIYDYEATAFGLVAPSSPAHKSLGELQVHEVTRAELKEWFGTFAAHKSQTTQRGTEVARAVRKTMRIGVYSFSCFASEQVLVPIEPPCPKVSRRGT